VAFKFEAQSNRAEPDRRVPADGHRSAKIEVPLGADLTTVDLKSSVDGDRTQRHPSAGDERLEQHVTRARERAIAAARWVKPRFYEGPPCLHGARDSLGCEVPAGAKRDDSACGVLAVPLFEWRLKGTQLITSHKFSFPRPRSISRLARRIRIDEGGWVLAVFKSRRTGKRTWGISAFVDEPPAKVKAFAYCTRHLDVKVRSNQSDPIPTEGASDATASCHRRETLLSGGYTTTPKSDFSNDTGPDFFYFRSLRSGSRSWTATAHNYSDIAGQITTFAYCKA
jgi:hypothetical protein